MARVPRQDAPGAWFHVMNRGIAKRTAFENRADMRYFLSRIAYAVRRGEIEVHAFCLMATHYHMLVRSPEGRLSEGMRRIQNEYVRYFNRARRRDGALFRGRFRSHRVDSLTYQQILVRYIDENPVKAGMVRAPSEYLYGSARLYVQGRWPKWLTSTWVMEPVRRRQDTEPHANYETVWGVSTSQVENELIAARISRSVRGPDPLDDLVHGSSRQVQAWMVRKAELADSTRPGLILVSEAAVLERIRRARLQGEAWTYRTALGKTSDAWGVAAAGLLRVLAACSYVRIAAALGLSLAGAKRRVHVHNQICRDPEYAERVSRLAARCLAAAYPFAPPRV